MCHSSWETEAGLGCHGPLCALHLNNRHPPVGAGTGLREEDWAGHQEATWFRGVGSVRCSWPLQTCEP